MKGDFLEGVYDTGYGRGGGRGRGRRRSAIRAIREITMRVWNGTVPYI